MSEWLNVQVSKTCVPQGIGGSNPPLSATILSIRTNKVWVDFCLLNVSIILTSTHKLMIFFDILNIFFEIVYIFYIYML